jgi:3-oxoacyl-[acyl-carrier-protein] synthase II
MRQERRVVVTGIGILSPLGCGAGAFWESCLRGQGVVLPIPEAWRYFGDVTSPYWAPLPEIRWEEFQIQRVDALQLDPVQKLGLAACQQALRDARFEMTLVDEKRGSYRLEGADPGAVGVFVGCAMGGMHSALQNMAHILSAPVWRAVEATPSPSKTKELLQETLRRVPLRLNPFVVSMAMPNACGARIGMRYSLKGPNRTYSSACASGTVAVGRAFQAVKSGEVDLAIAAGAEYLADPFGAVFRGFDAAQTLVREAGDPQEANRPFDRGRSGFLFSEGAGAVLVLEEWSSVRKRLGDSARAYAEIASFAETFDAYSIVRLEPEGREIRRMIHSALSQAELRPEDIDYINAHGTGTRLNDEIESRVIEEIFGKRPLVNSTKSLLGHSMGASGAIEAAVTALTLFHGKAHPCRNLDDPIRDLNFVREVKTASLRAALSHSFAFGGHNAGVVMKEFPNERGHRA